MSKQLRTPEQRAPEKASETAKEVVVDGLGNAAIADRMVAGEVASSPQVMVEHALSAAQIEPRGADRIERLCTIVDQSRLPDDRKAEITERLRASEAVAQQIAAAAATWFAGMDRDGITVALADAVRTETQSEAVAGFAQQVSRLMLWDEDEEEGLGGLIDGLE